MDARTTALRESLKELLKELEEGRGRKSDDFKEKSVKESKEVTAPKRVSDRLVSVEAQREEAERLRLSRFEEQSRNRDTRRNRWLDEQAQRLVAKLRRSYEKLMGIQWERKKGEQSSDEEDDSSDDEQSAARSEATADERVPSRSGRGSRNGAASGRTSRGAGSKRGRGAGVRVTRNQGHSTLNLAESGSDADGSETESESEEWAGGDEEDEEDDKGCEVCGAVEPPEDGSNPILLCDNNKCDKQYCIKCVGLDEVPAGKWSVRQTQTQTQGKDAEPGRGRFILPLFICFGLFLCVASICRFCPEHAKARAK
jgi:hypothetical protein